MNIAVHNTIIIVILPPKITEGINPINDAANPLSKAPISFDDPINTPFTAETLPRISSGVNSCAILPLITMLTLSNEPLAANSNNDNIDDLEL